MKFIDLKKIDINRNDAYKKFEEELNKFKQKHDKKFELDYYSTDELVVKVDNPREFNESIHDDLCSNFDVRLQFVCKNHIQTPKAIREEIEFVYAPVHHYITVLEWEDIKL